MAAPIDASNLHRGFVTEGIFVALPLRVPDETHPIPLDESRVRSLALSPDGLRVYGTTGGSACHLFAASHRGTVGGVVDVAVVPGAIDLPFVVAAGTDGRAENRLLVGANTARGAALYACEVTFPRDTIQEPTFVCSGLELVAELPGERLYDGLACPSGAIWSLADRGLISVDAARGDHSLLAEGGDGSSGPPTRLVRTSADAVCWVDGGGRVRAVNLPSREPLELTVELPAEGGAGSLSAWQGMLVHADSSGVLRTVDLDTSSVTEVCAAPVSPVQCMAALPDGRLFGVCGEGIGLFFCAELHDRQVRDLGAIASVVVSRRYGFEFSCAVVGRDGEVYLGENDRGGHLWLYMPPQPHIAR